MVADPQAQGPLGDGRILIDWTIGAQPPSATACAGVDHLVLLLAYDDGQQVQIAPVPCTLTRFRYDYLPVGGGAVQLVALDGPDDNNACIISEGMARIDVSATLPAQPTPAVALGAVHVCR
jgi:hypothetical protein